MHEPPRRALDEFWPDHTSERARVARAAIFNLLAAWHGSGSNGAFYANALTDEAEKVASLEGRAQKQHVVDLLDAACFVATQLAGDDERGLLERLRAAEAAIDAICARLSREVDEKES